jgi:type IV pilus assembly protein PilA
MTSHKDGKKQSAFTLVELLLVVAIIGILASIVIQNVSGARPKAQEVKMLSSLRSALPVAMYCVEDGNNLIIPDAANLICVGQRNWPALTVDGWAYGDAGVCVFDGDVSDNTFMYCATNGTKIIQCTNGTCSKI